MKTLRSHSCFAPALILVVLILFLQNPIAAQMMQSRSYPEGFTLMHPYDWQARIVDKAHILVSRMNSSNSPFILVSPFFLKQTTRSSRWLQQNLSGLGDLMKDVTIEMSRQIRTFPDETAVKFRFQKDGAVYQGIALCSIHEKSGMAYVVAAPRSEFEIYRNQLISMLESFRFTEASSSRPQSSARPRSAARPAVSFRNFQDPAERAFSLQVPAGWKISGGTFRRASVDIVHVLEAVSADGKIRIRFNDTNIPVFAAPNSTLAMAGFVEGSWYSPGYGVRMLVKRYTPGLYFMREYLQMGYGSKVRNFKFVNQQDRSDIVANFNRIYSQFMTSGVSLQLQAGEAAFRFEENNAPFVGYGLALTEAVQVVGTPVAQWKVSLLLVYSCPEGEAEQVRQIASHMFQSLKINPQWVASQQQIAANVSQIVTQTNREITNIINDSYWTRQAVLDGVNERFSDYILGVTDVVDHETGLKWKVEAGHNYYWRKETGEIVGTQTSERPDINFSPLKEF